MKKIISLLLILTIITSFSMISAASEYDYVPDLSEYSVSFTQRLNEWSDHESEADALNYLGLFKGTSNGYELLRAPTRIEALVTIIRLIGRESEALSQNIKSTFTDVPGWASAYAGYGQQNNIIKGIGGDLMGAQDPILPQQYVTMLLRVLDYNDDENDFSYEDSMEFAGGIGLITSQDIHHFATGSDMIRGDMAYFMYRSLGCEKNNGSLLIMALVKSGVISENAAYGTMLKRNEPTEEIHRALSNGYSEAWLKQIEAAIDGNPDISDIFMPTFKLSIYNWLKEAGGSFNVPQIEYRMSRLTTKVVRPSSDPTFSNPSIAAYYLYPNQIVVRSDVDIGFEDSTFSHELRHALTAGMEIVTLEEGLVELFNQEVDGGHYGYSYYYINMAKLFTHLVGSERMNEISYMGNYEDIFYEIELKTGVHMDKTEFRKIIYNISANAGREESWKTFTNEMSELIYAYYMKNNAALDSQSGNYKQYIDTLIALEQLMYFPSAMVRDAETHMAINNPSEYYNGEFEKRIYSIIEDYAAKTSESVNTLKTYYNENRNTRYCAKYFGPDTEKIMIRNADATKVTYKYQGSYYYKVFGRMNEAKEFEGKRNATKVETISNGGFTQKDYN